MMTMRELLEAMDLTGQSNLLAGILGAPSPKLTGSSVELTPDYTNPPLCDAHVQTWEVYLRAQRKSLGIASVQDRDAELRAELKARYGAIADEFMDYTETLDKVSPYTRTFTHMRMEESCNKLNTYLEINS